MIHKILSMVQHAVPWNRISDFTGYAALRLPLQRARHDGELTLNVPGYQQLDNFSCGAVAAAMVVKCLRPQVSFERIHAAVNPTQKCGAGTMRVLRALRSLRVGVSRMTHLTFDDVCHAIDAGRPVMVCVKTADTMTDHWTVIYGYGRQPNLVFIAGRGLHFMPVQRMKWPDFRKQWTPPGEVLVCWKARTRKTTARTVKKK